MIKLFRLVTGELIIGKGSIGVGEFVTMVENPYQLIQTQDGMGLAPFLTPIGDKETVKKGVFFSDAHIVYQAKVDSLLENEYNNRVTGIETPPKPQIQLAT